MSDTLTLTSSSTPTPFQYAAQTSTPMPNSYLLSFNMVQTDWMAVVRYLSSSDFWIIGCDGSGNPLVYTYNGSTYTQVAASNETIVANSRVLVFFGEIRFGTTSDIWQVAALWCNGHFMVHHAVKVTASLTQDHYFGFALRESRTRTFSKIHIPELTELAEVCTIDPGETPLSALQRTIEGRNVKYLMRPSGALKAYKPGPQSISSTLVMSRLSKLRTALEVNAIKSHIRMVGAYDQAEYLDADLSQRYGYRFTQQQNPYLMNQGACLEAARMTLKRIQEHALNESFNASVIHFLEQEDRILTPRGNRLISSIEVVYLKPLATASIQTRDYVYE